MKHILRSIQQKAKLSCRKQVHFSVPMSVRNRGTPCQDDSVYLYVPKGWSSLYSYECLTTAKPLDALESWSFICCMACALLEVPWQTQLLTPRRRRGNGWVRTNFPPPAFHGFFHAVDPQFQDGRQGAMPPHRGQLVHLRGGRPVWKPLIRLQVHKRSLLDNSTMGILGQDGRWPGIELATAGSKHCFGCHCRALPGTASISAKYLFLAETEYWNALNLLILGSFQQLG